MSGVDVSVMVPSQTGFSDMISKSDDSLKSISESGEKFRGFGKERILSSISANFLFKMDSSFLSFFF